MPVVKNDWDIYKSNRSRRSSECSNPQTCRSRKVSECKSEGPSLSTSPGSDFIVGSPAHRSVPVNMSSRQYSRASSRTSQTSLQSPCKSTSSSPPKSGSQSSLNKFHNRLVDKLKRSLRHKDTSSNDATSSWVEHAGEATPCSKSQPVNVPDSKTKSASLPACGPFSC